MQTGAETLEHDECRVGAAGGEGGDGGLDDDALGAGRVVCVADTQLPTASAGMSKSRLVQGGGYAYTAFVELSEPRRAGGVEGECVAAGQEGAGERSGGDELVVFSWRKTHNASDKRWWLTHSGCPTCR